MAQTDTGMGWNAKDEWLTQSGNTTIANIGGLMGGTAFPGQPLPKNLSSAADVIAHGLYFGTIENSGGVINTVFVASASDATIYACEYGNPAMASFYSDTDDSLVIWVRVTEPGGTIQRQELKCSTDLSVTGGTVYRFTQQKYFASWNPSIAVPHFASDTEARSNLYYVNDPIKKKNEGFAVTCVAKWKTPNGTILESPVLISTESDYVEMESTDTSLDYAKLKILYNGINFYMGFYNRLYTGTLSALVPEIDRSYESAPSFTLEELFKYIAKDVYANIQVTNVPDPYQEGDGSGEGGLDGEEDEGEDIDFTDAPVSGIAYSGFLTIFTPNLSQLQSLANYMWSDFFDVDTWKKLFANPMDAILGLHIIPTTPGYSGNKEVKVGGKGTGVFMDYTTIRYHKVNLGTCEVPKKWGAYLDFNPYTKVSIFLPFIGFRDLDTDDIMGKTISLQYIVDILTGACVAELKCGAMVLYSWQGNCANPVPITSNSWTSAIGSALSIAGAIATTALTHGASAPLVAGTVASVGANSMNLKPSVSRSGSLGGSCGFIAHQKPYIIRTVPNLVIPADQNKFIGYPSFINASLGSLTGYNEISAIHLEGIPATGNELSEIETLLKGGVIF